MKNENVLNKDYCELKQKVVDLEADKELLHELLNRVRHKIKSLVNTQNYESEEEFISEFNKLVDFIEFNKELV